MAKKKTDADKDVSNKTKEVKETPKKKNVSKKVEAKTEEKAVKTPAKKETLKETKKEESSKETVKAKTKEEKTSKEAVKDESKKDTSKKKSSKKPTKKNNKKKVEVKEEPKVEETVSEVKEEVVTPTQEVVDEPTVEETETEEVVEEPKTEEKVEEAKTEEKVEATSTTTNYTYSEPTKKKKKHTGLIIFLVIVALLAAAVGVTLHLLDNTSKLDPYFDDIDALKSQITITDEQKDQSKEDLLLAEIAGTLTIDEQGNASVSVTKPMIYNYMDLETINNLDAVKSKEIVINKIGYNVDTENALINVYSSFTYKGFIKGGIVGQFKYDLTDSGVVITYESAKVGELPEFIYSKYLPAKGTVIYSQEFGEVEIKDGIKVKLLTPSMIKDEIVYTDDGVLTLSINSEDLIKNVLSDLTTTDDNGNSKLTKLIEAYAKEVLGSDVDVSGIAQLVGAFVGNIDLSQMDLSTLFKLLG